MKKIFVVCCIFFAVFGLFSCDLRDAIVGPLDTWCMRTITIQGCDVDCYLIFTENGYSNAKLNAERFPDGIAPGLTIVLNPVNDGVIGDLTSNCYTVKQFPIGTSVEGVEEGTTKEFKVNNNLWNLIWGLNSTTFKANGPSENPPSILRTEGNLEFLENVKDLSWKDVLIAFIQGI